MKMRTKFRLGQTIVWKNKYGICKGIVVGLHDDFIKVKETSLGICFGGVNRIKFEDVIARV